jgi:hypothetical protein
VGGNLPGGIPAGGAEGAEPAHHLGWQQHHHHHHHQMHQQHQHHHQMHQQHQHQHQHQQYWRSTPGRVVQGATSGDRFTGGAEGGRQAPPPQLLQQQYFYQQQQMMMQYYMQQQMQMQMQMQQEQQQKETTTNPDAAARGAGQSEEPPVWDSPKAQLESEQQLQQYFSQQQMMMQYYMQQQMRQHQQQHRQQQQQQPQQQPFPHADPWWLLPPLQPLVASPSSAEAAAPAGFGAADFAVGLGAPSADRWAEHEAEQALAVATEQPLPKAASSSSSRAVQVLRSASPSQERGESVNTGGEALRGAESVHTGGGPVAPVEAGAPDRAGPDDAMGDLMGALTEALDAAFELPTPASAAPSVMVEEVGAEVGAGDDGSH